tara:strand:+ start:4431 stop:4571 length:141 start_codon:yes stop_codon:yes gene_type:complete
MSCSSKREDFTKGTFSKDFCSQQHNSALRRERRRLQRLENKLKKKA